MPRGGDSLFMAVAHQLDPHVVKLKERAHNLRLGVCHHLLNGLDEYLALLMTSIEAHGYRYSLFSSQETKVLRFLRDLAMPGFPAGAESLQALADMMHVDIVVFQQNSKKWYRSSAENINRTIGLVRHQLRNKSGPGQFHYDSVHSISTYTVEQPNGGNGAFDDSPAGHVEITEINGDDNGNNDTPYHVQLPNNGEKPI